MKSIQSKILLVVIAGLLVITAVVSAIAVNMTHEIMHRDADRILKNATQREAAYLNDILGDVIKSSSIMEHYATSEILSAEQLRDKDFCEKYLEKAEIMFAEVGLNTRGIEGFYMRLAPKYTDGKTGFYKMVVGANELQDMKITDLTQYDPNDKKNTGWYYEAVQAGEGVWLDPYYFPGNPNQIITYAQPLLVGENVIGVIGFDMNFSYLVQRIEQIGVYEDGYAVLLAKDRKTPYNEIHVGESHDPHTSAAIELENGMFLELRADYKDIQKDIHPMLNQIVLAFVVVLLISIVYTVFVTRKIVRPLKQLTAAAQSITSGVSEEKLVDIPISSKDEIGTLSRVLINAYSKIQEYTTYINALAYRDSLTGIKNSTAYTEAIDNLNKEIRCGNPQFGVLVADINNLKQTNDKYGHDVGNDLIVHTAKILMDTFKTSTVFRIGGDEFVVLLRGNDYNHYHTLLERMDEACAKEYITASEHAIPVHVARGVALFDPTIDNIYKDVFAKADHAMYMNKEQSKTVAPR